MLVLLVLLVVLWLLLVLLVVVLLLVLLWLDPCIRTRVELLRRKRRLLPLVRLRVAVHGQMLRLDEGSRLVRITILVTHHRRLLFNYRLKANIVPT